MSCVACQDGACMQPMSSACFSLWLLRKADCPFMECNTISDIALSLYVTKTHALTICHSPGYNLNVSSQDDVQAMPDLAGNHCIAHASYVLTCGGCCMDPDCMTSPAHRKKSGQRYMSKLVLYGTSQHTYASYLPHSCSYWGTPHVTTTIPPPLPLPPWVRP